MAMAPKDPTSHGLTFKAANVVVECSGANIAPLLVCLMVPLSWTFDFIRDGTEVVGSRGASTSTGETFLRFREAWLSRESESESESEDALEDCEGDSEPEFKSDASSDRGLIGSDRARAFGAAIICSQDIPGILVAHRLFFFLPARKSPGMDGQFWRLGAAPKSLARRKESAL